MANSQHPLTRPHRQPSTTLPTRSLRLRTRIHNLPGRDARRARTAHRSSQHRCTTRPLRRITLPRPTRTPAPCTRRRRAATTLVLLRQPHTLRSSPSSSNIRVTTLLIRHLLLSPRGSLPRLRTTPCPPPYVLAVVARTTRDRACRVRVLLRDSRSTSRMLRLAEPMTRVHLRVTTIARTECTRDDDTRSMKEDQPV